MILRVKIRDNMAHYKLKRYLTWHLEKHNKFSREDHY